VADADFTDALSAADAVLCGNDLIVNDAMLEMAPKLKVIAKMGAGLDSVDISAATRHGAIVFHTPGVNNQAVADHTFALMLCVARKIPFCDRSLREKRWEHTKIMGLELWRKTLGLIGLGAIGQCVALRAKGFQMRIVAHDPFWPEAFARVHGIERMAVDDLLKVSDVVSIHCPLVPETHGMIDSRALGLMKPKALLINAARGGIVNERHLYTALKDRDIAGAGIDVFEEEPPTDSPLLELDNVVLTPHTAGLTPDAMNAMSDGAVAQLITYLNGEKPAHIVNPEVWGRG
jgi:D-3-phosphoglycerate dehydrogenase